MINVLGIPRNVPDEVNILNRVIFIPKCEATNEHVFASRDGTNTGTIFIHKNILYLLPSSAVSQSVLGPPDHDYECSSYLTSNQPSYIVYIKIKKGSSPRILTIFSCTS